jgi:uncharacterized membrane protein YeiH
MSLEVAIQVMDYVGVLACATSGALKAGRREMDLFGMFVLALITAVGGGTLRDLLLGRTPVFWLRNLNYLALCALATIIVFGLQRWITRGEKALLIFDAIGLGVFTVIGVSRGQGAGLAPVAAIGLGCLTGIGGGILRDLLALTRPVVLHREIYALASLGGGALLVLLNAWGAPAAVSIVACGAAVVIIRLLSLHYGWTVPGTALLTNHPDESLL